MSALAPLSEGGVPCDLLVTDLNLPGRSGEEVLAAARARAPSMPVLVVTGRMDVEALSRLRCWSRLELLPKPFPLADLRAALTRLNALACEW